MANIRKIENKSGTSYKITVSGGRDINGKQIRRFMTWTPAPGMTQRQIDKELAKQAIEFEKQIELGFVVNNKQTFSKYAEYAIEMKKQGGAKHSTISLYKSLLERINEGIGHLKLSDLRPQHLNRFYNNLSEAGIRKRSDRAYSKIDLLKYLNSKKITREKLATLSGASPSTITTACKGEKITLAKAESIARALNLKLSDIFIVDQVKVPLSNKSIIQYHRFISTVLDLAEKEMIVQYNAASKAIPPKVIRREANYFQPEELIQIQICLEKEPIKWRAITHLLMITGCRRGEIMGLKWSKVDFQNSQIKIDSALLYSSDIGKYEDTTKTGTTRFIKLPSETMQILKQYRSWYSEQQFLSGSKWHNTDYLFVQNNGLPMSPDSITSWLSDFSKRHDLPHINPHAFRHTMASILINNGKDIVSIAKRLGHAKVSTTTDIYSHIIKEADEQASDCLADVIIRPLAKSIG